MGAGHQHHHGHQHGHGHGHHHGHGHSHGHHHGHAHAHPTSGNVGRAFAIAVSLNLIFVVAEVAAGFISGSMALLADAGHNLSDVLSLMLAWAAAVLSARPPSERFTYGLKSSSILAAIANAALLWVAIGAILVETIRRMAEPEPVGGTTMMIVAGLGIAVNGLSALLFAKGSKSDLNLRGAFVHLMADALVSVGVVIAGLVITWTGWALVDPITSLVITAVIGWSSWGLLRDSLRMGMLGVPEGIDGAKVRAFLAARPGVVRVHDLHIWPMSTTETALTAHLVMPGGQPGDAFLCALADDLAHEFGIGHPTIQIETDPTSPCALESEGVV
ncbi:cation diffusion facilitator family transporter [Novosphingobium kaempferiae]|uniref:cation diffusion facilitator family transporter n=1 Tax=Novosphingobium kaempferiae TaxID=2896849 RepID=UPI001E584F60|nr:cation diffusion facilitator family transporter [Novosphingobium kaempferiae]